MSSHITDSEHVIIDSGETLPLMLNNKMHAPLELKSLINQTSSAEHLAAESAVEERTQLKEQTSSSFAATTSDQSGVS
jgi:hypothetical protein